jgi:tRNA threonylcarbamoyladenosine biosynthesis protein TsaE
MSDNVIETANQQETAAAGHVLAELVQPGDVITLTGDLGAGKTCLVKGVARGLGVVEPVTSPTFNILLVHHGRLDLNHFDLYRLERAEELEDIDFWGTLEAGGVSFVEWGERFGEALPDDHLAVTIEIVSEETRTLTLAPTGPRSTALAAAWAGALRSGGRS